ncbi:MAG TPA: DUF2207 domain-containing protein [Xanthobacteraceae bacterium]|nr:DUF2207 domain-containing protein [Xanthobacteraceae bacterium]
MAKRMAATMRSIALALIVCATALGAREAQAAEEILRFDADVQVARDGTLTVTETIRVRAEGRDIRRGIYRDFPLTFVDAEGTWREVTFTLLDVTRDGKREPHFTRRADDAIRIYAGDENTMLRPGEYTYTLRYRTGRQIRWFDDAPELNWNVTGNFWIFPIRQASARITFESGARPVRWIAYTGPFGARGTAWRAEAGNGLLTVETTEPLAPREGLTVVATLPADAVAPPGRADRLWYAAFDNRGWLLGGGGFLALLAYYLWAWNAVGRDPKRGTVIPLFHPPDGVSPALANYIANWGLSDIWRAFTAAALSLAVRGLLVFDDGDKSLTLRATGRQPDGGSATLPAGERAIFDWVRAAGGSGTIDRDNSASVAELVKDFRGHIAGENRNRFFRHNLGYFLAGLVLTALVVAVIVKFGGLREAELALMFGAGFIGLFFGLFAIPLVGAIFGTARGGSRLRSAFVLIFLAVFLFNAGGIFMIAGSTLAGVLSDNIFPVALIAGFTALNGLFLYLLRAPTDIGRKMMDQLAGLRLYLETAESDRLNMQAPEITADRFEALLPYAVALNVEKPWSDAFAAALARAHPGEADATTLYQPGWRRGGAWSGGSFGRSVAATVAGIGSAMAAAMPAPSSGSSGFSSSGGGSGGGGGGGGGGGW